MIVLVVIAAFVVVVALAAWSRRAAGRAERRSVQSYGRTLGVLADVSRRSEKRTVRSPSGDEVARPHVRPNEDLDAMRPAATTRPDVPAPRVRLQPPSLPGQPHGDEPAAAARASAAPPPGSPAPPPSAPPPSTSVPPGLVARGLVPPAPGVPAVASSSEATSSSGATSAPDEPAILFDDAPEPQEVPGRGRRELRHLAPGHDHVARRAATGAAAAVVLAALAVGGYELVSSRTPAVHGATGSRSTGSTSSKLPPTPKTTPTSSTTPTTVPTTPTKLEPTSESTSVVAYDVPEQSYTITLAADTAAACWIGIEQSVNGPYLQMDTLAPGATWTYQASGPVVVRVGNPRVLTLAVDGVKVDLPAGRVQVYDVTLTPASTSTAA